MIKLYRFIKPYRWAVLVVMVFMLLQSLAQLYLPTLMADVVDIGVVQGDIPYIWKIGGLMLLVALIGTIFVIWGSYVSSKVATGFSRILRSKVFTHVEGFSLYEVDQIGTSSLINRTTNDITQVQQVTNLLLRIFISAPIMAIGGVIMAVRQDSTLSLVLVVVIPALAAIIYFVARKAIPLFKSIQIKLDQLNLVLREGLIGIRVIRAFNRVDHEKNRFHQANTNLTDTTVQANLIMAALMPIMMLSFNFATIAILWFGGIRIDNGAMQVGSLMAFIQYAMQIMFSLVMVSMMFVMIPRAAASAVRINEVLDTAPRIKESTLGKKADERRGYLEFRHVSFSYPGAERSAINDISFHARPGEVTAFIGGTGSGKSTLIHLIMRFYDIDRGDILMNGVDIRQMTTRSLRDRIGYVPQKAVLFTGSIADNIRLGKEEATDEEIRHAAETAQAVEFITEMENGFDGMITQGGSNLSGGQKQRMAIARALVRRPEIYIFDDSFSALDFKTDARLRAALKQETGDSTVLIVAQRVTTIIDADQIVVLDEGEVKGIGKHQELMKTCKVYREIVASQLSEEEIA